MEPTTTRSSHFFFILALLLNACDYSHAMGIREKEEPQCNSRFEYEYKVLQKLVELETSQKELQDTIILHEETLEKRDETITALETSQKALQETIKIQGDVIAAQAVKLEDYDLVLKETTSSLDEVRVKINETDRELKETVSSLGDARTKINELEHKDMAGKLILIF